MEEYPVTKPATIITEEPLTDHEISERAGALCLLMTEIEKEEADLASVKNAFKGRIAEKTTRLNTLRGEIETKIGEKEIAAVEVFDFLGGKVRTYRADDDFDLVEPLKVRDMREDERQTSILEIEQN